MMKQIYKSPFAIFRSQSKLLNFLRPLHVCACKKEMSWTTSQFNISFIEALVESYIVLYVEIVLIKIWNTSISYNISTKMNT